MGMFVGSSRRQSEHALMRLQYDRKGQGKAMKEIHEAWLERQAGRGPHQHCTLLVFLEQMILRYPQIKNAGSIKNAMKRWRAAAP